MATTMERVAGSSIDRITQYLGSEAESLLSYPCKGVPKERLMLPGPDHVERAWVPSDRKPGVLVNLQRLYGTGRLANTGYLSILPVDQGIEHSGAASFAPNIEFFDPETIVRLAIDGGCNAVASTVAVLGAVSRKYAHKIPFIAKINHNELLTYPNQFSQILFAQVEQAWDLGAAAVGATVYFGSDDSARAAMQADIVKQKQATLNGGYNAVGFGKTDPRVYSELVADHPIDWTRWQVVNCFMGRASLINSGGESKGQDDLAQAVRTAVINKRAGGAGLISGRKAFQRPQREGIELLHAIQDVYLSPEVTIA
jgi:class I fructose-bisphosphate aldolase